METLEDFIKHIESENPDREYLKAKLKKRSSQNKLIERAIKRLLNGLYGAFGFRGFHFYNKHIAESITMQSQEVISAVGKRIEEYFHNEWHLDGELHKELGITATKKVEGEVWVYTDTDSNMVTLLEAREKSDYKGDAVSFGETFYRFRGDQIVNDACQSVFDKYNGINYMTFDLEYIAPRAIWSSKKNYIVEFGLLDGVRLEERYIKIYGLPPVRSDSPVFCRKTLKKFYEYTIENNGGDLSEIVKDLRVTKRLMKTQDLEDICENKKITNYRKWIINDTGKVEYKKNTPFHIKAAAYYNNYIRDNDLLHKYPLIDSGDKVKLYFTKDEEFDMFAFLPGYFPHEVAPSVNYDEQFNKYYLDKVNDILKLTHDREVSPNLSTSASTF